MHIYLYTLVPFSAQLFNAYIFVLSILKPTPVLYYLGLSTLENSVYVSGYKIPQIENMGATLDQFDTIDFSDNDVRKLDGFPLLKRLKCLLLNNNRIV